VGDGVDHLRREVVVGALERDRQLRSGIEQSEQVVDPPAVPAEEVVDARDVQARPPGQVDALVRPGLEAVRADERDPVGDRVADRYAGRLQRVGGGVDGITR
jgi:hypothetical protein